MDFFNRLTNYSSDQMEWEMLLTDYFLKLEARGRRLYSSWFLFFFVCGDGRHLACGILVPPTGIKPIAGSENMAS